MIKSGFYVSFGAALVRNRPTLVEAFQTIPPDKLFLETDDQTLFDIIQIYETAAKLKSISISELEFTIESNKIVFLNSHK